MREADLQARVSRLRQIIADAVPIPQPDPTATTGEADAWRRYAVFAANEPLPAADDSYRAKSIRKINRLAIYFGWAAEIQKFLDEHDASSISALADDQVDSLLHHMLALEDCMREGCDPPDMPAAR
jgi:hypothetical protein